MLFCCRLDSELVTNSGLKINFDYLVFLMEKLLTINDNCNVT